MSNNNGSNSNKTKTAKVRVVCYSREALFANLDNPLWNYTIDEELERTIDGVDHRIEEQRDHLEDFIIENKDRLTDVILKSLLIRIRHLPKAEVVNSILPIILNKMENIDFVRSRYFKGPAVLTYRGMRAHTGKSVRTNWLNAIAEEARIKDYLIDQWPTFVDYVHGRELIAE